MVLNCPEDDDLAPNVLNEDFSVELQTSTGKPLELEDVYVALSADGGSFNAPLDEPDSDGANTDDDGILAFGYTPAETIVKATQVTIKAEVEVEDAKDLTTTCTVTVRPDVFRFTTPDPNAEISSGSDNAEALSFEWKNAAEAGGGPVDGEVCLKADKGTLIRVNNDPSPQSEAIVRVEDGVFVPPVDIFNNGSAFSTITATDCAVSGRKASLTVQFTDDPGDRLGTADIKTTPTIVEPFPSDDRFSALEYTLLNDNFSPATGIDMVFFPSAGGKVFPGGGTTNSQGKVTARFEATTQTDADITITACVEQTEGNFTNCVNATIVVQTPTP